MKGFRKKLQVEQVRVSEIPSLPYLIETTLQIKVIVFE